MSTEEIVIAIVRVLGSLPVLRWAFAGGVIAVLVDLSDLFLKNYLTLGGVSDYQSFDKLLDQVYMATFLIVAWRWEGRPRTIALALYAYRLLGFVVFETVGPRGLLIAFPNVFEFWFLFVAWQRHWRPGFRYSGRNVAIALGALTALKLFQEYALHVGQWLDTFSTKDVVDAVTGLFG